MPAVRTLVIPKVNNSADLDQLEEALLEHSQGHCTYNLVASIESARAMWNIGHIAGWQQKHALQGTKIKLNALLVCIESVQLWGSADFGYSLLLKTVRHMIQAASSNVTKL
jgi:citrate lyase beta subunit